jgi:hypothetical protein
MISSFSSAFIMGNAKDANFTSAQPLAGQLYPPDYQEYLQLCEFLGIYTKELRSVGDISIQLDGFIKPEHRENAPRSGCPFTESPVGFLKELIGLRRKGMGFTSTRSSTRGR